MCTPRLVVGRFLLCRGRLTLDPKLCCVFLDELLLMSLVCVSFLFTICCLLCFALVVPQYVPAVSKTIASQDIIVQPQHTNQPLALAMIQFLIAVGSHRFCHCESYEACRDRGRIVSADGCHCSVVPFYIDCGLCLLIMLPCPDTDTPSDRIVDTGREPSRAWSLGAHANQRDLVPTSQIDPTYDHNVRW